jgi:putative FmdB family regulatory protein
MPLYEYHCLACGERFEQIRKFSDPPLEVCAKCGKGPIERLISSPAFQFKGSGWYVTDYAQKDKKGGGTSSSKTEAKKDDSAASTSSTPATPASTPAPAAPSKD